MHWFDFYGMSESTLWLELFSLQVACRVQLGAVDPAQEMAFALRRLYGLERKRSVSKVGKFKWRHRMARNLVVLVREVWDTRDLVGGILDETGQIRNDALDTRFETEDLNALEMALRIKDDQEANVTAISVGSPSSVDVLRECMYRGVDSVVRVDADPRELDAQATSALCAAAVKDIGECDLILVGSTVADSENSLLGVYLAGDLGIDSVNWVDELKDVSENKVIAKRAIEMGYEDVEVGFPAVISVGVALLEDDPRSPRNAKAMLKLKKKKEDIPVKDGEALGVAAPANEVTTKVAGFEPVERRVIESREIDPEDESALQSMLNEVLKGE